MIRRPLPASAGLLLSGGLLPPVWKRPASGLDSPTITGAQAANELLEIKGIKASVVLTDYNNTIYFSARSIDEVNVQVEEA